MRAALLSQLVYALVPCNVMERVASATTPQREDPTRRINWRIAHHHEFLPLTIFHNEARDLHATPLPFQRSCRMQIVVYRHPHISHFGQSPLTLTDLWEG